MENIIQYSVRVSKRAKRLHIKINRLAQVEVVSPLRITKTEIDRFVKSNKTWIEHHKKKISSGFKQDENFSNDPPNKIHFPFLEETFHVVYLDVIKKSKTLVDENTIHIYSNSDEEKKILLRKFIHDLAKKQLTILLDKMSEESGLTYNRVFIKAQKTRWGSCSSKKNINLNRNLLFLKPDQVEYLIIHELCHTVHLNHSSRYWKLVEEIIPSYKELDKSLKNATLNVPFWALS